MTERIQIFNYVCVLANDEIAVERLKDDQLLECVCLCVHVIISASL